MPNQRVERIFCPGRAKNPLTRDVGRQRKCERQSENVDSGKR